MNYYVDVIKRYADFNGRSRRQEYWMFVLCTIPVVIVLTVIDFALGSYPVITWIYTLAVFPSDPPGAAADRTRSTAAPSSFVRR
ncbi:DUF805 domain-containing protein [Streptomyces sp. NPDC048383]|uniref:DUF805 domain-containing protein n=1 Tax=Streptomyces sp. NPDC048383 TaxID=3155386 RepID=UPI0034322CB4